MIVEILIIVCIIGLVLAISSSVTAVDTFRRYNKKPIQSGITAGQFTLGALQIKKMQVQLCKVRGSYTDFYSSKHKQIALSEPVVGNSSVTAIAIAAHEFGHACQDNENYIPFRFLHFVRTIARILQIFLWPILLAGLYFLLFEYQTKYDLAITLLIISAVTWLLPLVLKLLTLPIEINASKRALKFLKENNVMTSKELRQAKKVLNAAVLTYVGSIFEGLLLVFALLFGKLRITRYK